ncbi:hypothetical protein Tco_0529518 [Tanacetum coccineum]
MKSGMVLEPSGGGVGRRLDSAYDNISSFWLSPTNFEDYTRLAAFKLEGDALSWYFPASEQQRYEHEYGSICQLDRENSGEYMERHVPSDFSCARFSSSVMDTSLESPQY